MSAETLRLDSVTFFHGTTAISEVVGGNFAGSVVGMAKHPGHVSTNHLEVHRTRTCRSYASDRAATPGRTLPVNSKHRLYSNEYPWW